MEAGEGCLNVNKDIKKFLDNVDTWSNKLDELFADSQAQAKMITEIVESHQGLGKMEHKVAYLEKKLAAIEINNSNDDEESGTQSGARIGNLEKLVDDLTSQMQGNRVGRDQFFGTRPRPRN